MNILQKTLLAIVLALIPADAADTTAAQLHNATEYYKTQARLNIDLLIYKIHKNTK